MIRKMILTLGKPVQSGCGQIEEDDVVLKFRCFAQKRLAIGKYSNHVAIRFE
jgi:hypothetical protein